MLEYLDTEDMEIEVYAPQLNLKEIETLYFINDSLSYVPNLNAVLPKLERYFEEMDKGFSPFVFEDSSFFDLKTDTSDLSIFMKKLKNQRDKSTNN